MDEVLADVRTQSIQHVFAANSALLQLWLLVEGAILYWAHTWPPLVGIVMISISAPHFLLFYGLMWYTRKTHTKVALVCFVAWAISGACVVASTVLLTRHVIAIQMTLLFLLQSFSVMAYAKLSPRNIDTFYAVALMFVVTLMGWAISIYTFVIDNDWTGGIVVLGISFVAIAFHGWKIHTIDGYYSVSWEDIQLSIIEFYYICWK